MCAFICLIYCIDVRACVRACVCLGLSGQSIDLHGKEGNLIVREAANYWNEQTTDDHQNMREKINTEIAEVAENSLRNISFGTSIMCDN